MSTLYKFSSNPLSTIFPGSSGEKQPNYNNAFNITLGNPYSKWQTGLQFSTDYAKAFNTPDNSYSQWQTGPQFSTDYAQEFLNKTNGTSIIPTEGEPKSPGSGASPWGYIGKAADLIGSFMPEKDEYSGEKGGVTQSLDSAYDNISNTLMAIPGWGTLAGGIMKAGALLGKGMNALGGGTDGMCVCAGTKVFTSTGKVVNIEDLQKEEGIIGWNEGTKEIKPQTIHNFIEPRQKECVEIVLKNGYSIRCSIDHPILSNTSPKAKSKYINGKRMAIREWKFRRADELKTGDFVGLANDIDYWGDNHLDNAYLVGLLIGDGSYGKGASCRIISADQDTWKYLEDNNLGIINHCDDSRPEKYNKEIRTYRIIGGIELMKQLGIAYQTGKEKTLPKNIGEFDKQSICNLIAGLFDTDGSISVNEDKKNYSITLYQSNRDLLEEVRIQLHKLGIFSTINTRKPTKYELRGKIINSNESYRLEIHDISSAKLFCQFIPLNISYKKENLSRIFNMLKDSSPQEHNDISGAKQCKIVSITHIGIQTVYNLQADNDHTYLANGIITHNTTTDAILGSSFFNLTPLGLINGFGGTTSDTITKNERLFDSMGPSYSGTNQTVNDAVSKSGKKYGLFSSGALREANQEIMEAKRQQGVLTNISNEASARYNIRNSMSAINGNRRQYKLQGGYDQSSVRVGRKGMSLEVLNKEKQILLKPKSTFTKIVLTNPELTESPITTITLSIPEFKEGGTLSQKVKDYYNGYDLSDVTFINDSSPRTEGNIIYSPSDEYTVHELWHYLSQNKPNEALKEFYDQLDDTKLQQFGADLEFVKRTGDPGDFYSPSELEARLNAAKFMSQGSIYNKDFFRNLRSNENKYGDNMRDLLKMFNDDYLERLFNTLPKFQSGGAISTKIVLTNPELVESPITAITLSTPEFKDGGTISTKIVLTNPELVESPKKTRTLEELIEYAKKENPRFIQRMSEPLKFVEWEDDKGKHFGTHEMSYGEADGKIFIFPMIQEIDGNLVRYQDTKKALFNALDNKNVLQVNNEDEAKLFTESEELPDGTFTGYKSGWVDFFKQSPSKFQSGGSINVIPEGALHARKHNMDIDGITKKGIPVVSEGENGKVEQQAEIERSEIILRLSVTKKLEELSKIFYNEESSSKEKEEAALEAGKLLTKEIIYNTIDNTNELL